MYHVRKRRKNLYEEETKGSTDLHCSCTTSQKKLILSTYLLSMFILCYCTYTITDYLAASNGEQTEGAQLYVEVKIIGIDQRKCNIKICR
jgi:hypothetical protein